MKNEELSKCRAEANSQFSILNSHTPPTLLVFSFYLLL